MKVALAEPENQDKYMFIDKKKPEKCVTVTVKFACDNIIAAAAEYGQRFSESD